MKIHIRVSCISSKYAMLSPKTNAHIHYPSAYFQITDITAYTLYISSQHPFAYYSKHSISPYWAHSNCDQLIAKLTLDARAALSPTSLKPYFIVVWWIFISLTRDSQQFCSIQSTKCIYYTKEICNADPIETKHLPCWLLRLINTGLEHARHGNWLTCSSNSANGHSPFICHY